MPVGVLRDAPRPWTWLHQVHGSRVVVVTSPGEHAGADADAAVTTTPLCALVVRSADCAPVVLRGNRSVGVVHAGWRGLVAGVIAAAATALADLGDPATTAHLGPCIRPGCYEFDGPDRDTLTTRFGPSVAATTMWGTAAVDLPAAVAAALAEVGIGDVADEAGCTACDRRLYSHRSRGEAGRFATVAWIPDP